MDGKRGQAIGWCETHQRLFYDSPKAAKAAKRRHHDRHMSVWRCTEVEHLYHVGTLGPIVIRGEIDRSTLYGRAA